VISSQRKNLSIRILWIIRLVTRDEKAKNKNKKNTIKIKQTNTKQNKAKQTQNSITFIDK